MSRRLLSVDDMAAEIRCEMELNPTAQGIEIAFDFRGNADAVMVADRLFPFPDWQPCILVDGGTCYIIGLRTDRLDRAQRP